MDHKKPFISIIIPTYNEVENVAVIIPNIANVFSFHKLDGEIIIVDDSSPDGTSGIVRQMSGRYPVECHVRTGERGLASAIIHGFHVATGDICVVMDADLSHPVEKIPDLIRPIIDGRCDAAVGSRYIQGGRCDDWPWTRKMVSRGAGFLARGLTPLRDATSGFMAIRRDIVGSVTLDPIGWKIVLETIVKTKARVIEVPITFSDRRQGKSKFNFRAQKDYLIHLWKLYIFKYATLSQFVKFCLVGASGLVVDTLVLVSLVEMLHFDPRIAAVFAFLCAVSWNYLLNERWTFRVPKGVNKFDTYISFLVICLIGLAIRIGVMHLLMEFAGMRDRPWYVLASLLGIIAATIFNFLGSKHIVFPNLVQMK